MAMYNKDKDVEFLLSLKNQKDGAVENINLRLKDYEEIVKDYKNIMADLDPTIITHNKEIESLNNKLKKIDENLIRSMIAVSTEDKERSNTIKKLSGMVSNVSSNDITDDLLIKYRSIMEKLNTLPDNLIFGFSTQVYGLLSKLGHGSIYYNTLLIHYTFLCLKVMNNASDLFANDAAFYNYISGAKSQESEVRQLQSEQIFISPQKEYGDEE